MFYWSEYSLASKGWGIELNLLNPPSLLDKMSVLLPHGSFLSSTPNGTGTKDREMVFCIWVEIQAPNKRYKSRTGAGI